MAAAPVCTLPYTASAVARPAYANAQIWRRENRYWGVL